MLMEMRAEDFRMTFVSLVMKFVSPISKCEDEMALKQMALKSTGRSLFIIRSTLIFFAANNFEKNVRRNFKKADVDLRNR